MSAKKFRFVSPGIFLNEIDNSQLPREPREIGPLVVGRTLRGPAMRPVQVDSFADFVEVFGEPQHGGVASDPWRHAGEQAPTYAAYAAQAWLKNSATINVVRLLGKEHTNKTSGGEAGWKTTNALATSYPGTNNGGGAYGLWVFSGNGFGTVQQAATATGSLAATWYINSGSMALVGSDLAGTAVTDLSGAANLMRSDSSGNFTALIKSGNTEKRITFNLGSTHKNYIRKVFNTNPVLTNTSITPTAGQEVYWLGETYENTLLHQINGTSFVTMSAWPADPDDNGLETYDIVTGSIGTAAPGSATYMGVILGLKCGATGEHGTRQTPYVQAKDANGNPQTGWFFSQDIAGGAASASYAPANMTKLFKFHALDHGEWAQNNLKVSITNIKYSKDDFDKWGSFDILVRRLKDTDKSPVVLERFSNCNLNPDSINYVGRKVGTRYVRFDEGERVLRPEGEHSNRSKYVRIQVGADASNNSEFLPFGTFGPLKYTAVNIAGVTTGSFSASFNEAAAASPVIGNTTGATPNAYATGIIKNGGSGSVSGSMAKYMKFLFPRVPARISASQEGLSSNKLAYFGAYTGKTKTNGRFNEDIVDLVKNKASGLDQFSATTNFTEHSWAFSLDEIISGSGDYYWSPGSRPAGKALNSTGSGGSYKDILDEEIYSFTALLYGGSDGLDVKEKDQFRTTLLEDKTQLSNYAFNSVKEAVDICRDPEFAEFNLIAMPGIYHEGLTTHMIETAEARADAMAVIDLKGDFRPEAEGNAGKVYGTVATTITNLKGRGLNSSYACAYYPWVQIRDTVNGNVVFMPPSVAAIGAMSYTDRVRAPWFAPAGFNRGGLSSGVAGLPVINVTQKLTSKERDKLYEANINPIASFPNEGIVIFGQKTLQVTRSALDRINVRRLLLYVKKGIATISSDILFEPNVQETWDRFIGRAEPFLADVKARFGLTDYKLVLDKTTTTDDLVDRNIMYAKIFLKPARSIEFIAVDFIITNTGAAFED